MKRLLTKVSSRFVGQLVIVGIVFSLALIHQIAGIEKAAPIDAYCPFGAVESFFTLVFKGEFLKRIFTSAFILLGIFLVANLLLGRIFCGYFCPLGAIQEWLRALGKKMGFKKDLEIPEKFDKYLRYLKYFILIFVVYFSFYLGDLVFRDYDPYTSLMHFGKEFEEKIIGYIILAIVLIAALFSKSLWCRYFCPLGAFFGITKKSSFLKIERDKDTCVSCGACDITCPANLKIKTAEKITDTDCISCGKCIAKCPKSSLKYVLFNRKIEKKTFSMLVILLVAIPLIVAPFTPFWKTKPESNIVNVHGEVNTADIRGSNTLQYVIETTKIPLAEFQEKLDLPNKVDTSLKLKSIGLEYNIKNKDGQILETEDFREVVENYTEVVENKKEEISHGNCPFEEEYCSFPGDCGAYVDMDMNGYCDHSQ